MNVSFLLPLFLLLIVLWLFLIRPQRRRTQTQMEMQDRLRAGDEIITAGGLHATVLSIEGDLLEIEIAPDTVVTLDRRAVAAVTSPHEPEPEDQEPEPEDAAEDPAPSDDG